MVCHGWRAAQQGASALTDLAAEYHDQLAAETIAARMSARGRWRQERYLQRQSQAQIPGNYARRPDGWMMALQEIRGEERLAEQQQREAAERKAGLPGRRASGMRRATR